MHSYQRNRHRSTVPWALLADLLLLCVLITHYAIAAIPAEDPSTPHFHFSLQRDTTSTSPFLPQAFTWTLTYHGPPSKGYLTTKYGLQLYLTSPLGEQLRCPLNNLNLPTNSCIVGELYTFTHGDTLSDTVYTDFNFAYPSQPRHEVYEAGRWTAHIRHSDYIWPPSQPSYSDIVVIETNHLQFDLLPPGPSDLAVHKAIRDADALDLYNPYAWISYDARDNWDTWRALLNSLAARYPDNTLTPALAPHASQRHFDVPPDQLQPYTDPYYYRRIEGTQRNNRQNHGPLYGPLTEYDSEGHITHETHYYANRQHGPSIDYTPDGSIYRMTLNLYDGPVDLPTYDHSPTVPPLTPLQRAHLLLHPPPTERPPDYPF